MLSLNDERKRYLIERLALKDPLPSIKSDYERLFNEKVMGEELINFRSNYGREIEKEARKQLNNCSQEALAHSRIRLRYLMSALEYAMTPKATKSVPVRSNGKEVEYEVAYEPDYSAINNLIRTAQNEEFFVKKMFLDIKRLQLTKPELGGNGESGFDIIPVNDGLRALDNGS